MRILVVEDQALIGKAIHKGLTEEAFAVDLATSLAEGTRLAQEHEYDTIILDLMLPDGTGIDLLKTVREKNMRAPVLILSAKDTIDDKTEGYLNGTDDYMTKPFSFEELLLKVRALIRRKYQIYTPVIELGALKLDPSARTVSAHGTLLNLTAKEFAILELLLMKRSHILSRKTILEHLNSTNEEQESNVVDVFINKLRRKLESANVGPLIETVRGEGYVIR